MAFVLGQLSTLPNVKAKSMFGAYGLFSAGKIFGIVDQGRLYFKTDAQTEVQYTGRGMPPFTYEMRGRVWTMAYHEVPPEVLEQRQELIIWAGRAVKIGVNKPEKKSKARRNPQNKAC